LPLTSVGRPVISPFPPVLLDVALVVGAEHRPPRWPMRFASAGELLESLRLFDVYTATRWARPQIAGVQHADCGPWIGR